MKKENINNLSEEIQKIKYRVGYKISESPRYRPLISSNEEFDEVPVLTNEAGEEEVENPEGQAPEGAEPEGAEATAEPTDAESPVPAFDSTGGETPEDPMAGDMANPMGAPEPEKEVNDIQNEIIKHNIEAMKSIHDQLEGLNGVVQGLNSKLEALNADVQEVREPTNGEKLMNKTNVSYPYYFNLNDFWSGNWFNEKRDAEMEKGIKEMPDGSFVADFDDLPQKSKTDIQNSFNETI